MKNLHVPLTPPPGTHTYLIFTASTTKCNPKAVDTTAFVTEAPSRKAPKTIEGQWQAVKPPWGRP